MQSVSWLVCLLVSRLDSMENRFARVDSSKTDTQTNKKHKQKQTNRVECAAVLQNVCESKFVSLSYWMLCCHAGGQNSRSTG